mgnify:CR=1 FL=1
MLELHDGQRRVLAALAVALAHDLEVARDLAHLGRREDKVVDERERLGLRVEQVRDRLGLAHVRRVDRLRLRGRLALRRQARILLVIEHEPLVPRAARHALVLVTLVEPEIGAAHALPRALLQPARLGLLELERFVVLRVGLARRAPRHVVVARRPAVLVVRVRVRVGGALLALGRGVVVRRQGRLELGRVERVGRVVGVVAVGARAGLVGRGEDDVLLGVDGVAVAALGLVVAVGPLVVLAGALGGELVVVVVLGEVELVVVRVGRRGEVEVVDGVGDVEAVVVVAVGGARARQAVVEEHLVAVEVDCGGAARGMSSAGSRAARESGREGRDAHWSSSPSMTES